MATRPLVSKSIVLKNIDGLVALVRDAGSDPFLCVGRDDVAEAP